MNVDLDFLNKLKKGDGKTTEKFQILCHTSARYYVKDKDIAKDISSDTRDRVIKRLQDRKRPYTLGESAEEIDRNFKCYVSTTAHNLYRTYMRKKRRELTLGELAAALGVDEASAQDAGRGFDSLFTFIGAREYSDETARGNPLWRLAVKEVVSVFKEITSRRRRIAMILKHIHGFTIKEIAIIMRGNFSAINSLINQGNIELRKRLIKKGIDAGYLDHKDWHNKQACK
jgi:DNA-directed RNA polymerase specialized sigma24 family protein